MRAPLLPHRRLLDVLPVCLLRQHRTRDLNDHATSAPAELGEEMHNDSRSRARTQALLQARKLHVYGNVAFGAFWIDLADLVAWPEPAANPRATRFRQAFAWRYSSNATCLMRPLFVLRILRRLKDHRHLLHDSPLLKNTGVRQVWRIRQATPPETCKIN